MAKTQALTAKLVEFRIIEDKKAGTAPTASTDEIARLTFDGRDPVPVVQGNEVVLVYIGRMTPPTLTQLEQYPELKDAPAIELAPTKTQKTGAREAPLYVIAACVRVSLDRTR